MSPDVHAAKTSPTAVFRQARDLLLARREDYDSARAEFRWPALAEFNWALDWFDVIAQGNDRTALWIIGDNPGADEQRVSFAELSARSSQLAGWLHEHGAREEDFPDLKS